VLNPGDRAPDFELPDQDGRPRRLSELLKEGPVVLFWYPAAMTSGCTKESCHFRDLAGEFKAVGAQPIGISADSVGKQKQFDTAHHLGYPLLSDQERTVADQFGVRRKRITPVKRATFVIGTDGVISETIASEIRMDLHADKALEHLRQRPAEPAR
jgi:peroxiredoxin